ncbi:hypothetical protein DXM27_19145 [Rhizobium rhizogenes]|uniref:Uncharacterized protein n=1 Tax=Rhizobium rhizogenes TaxID=359 RepID=A0AA88EXT1_RHIRH|nr:hypothetical protein DXM27_19145 [Rhizobium rhizogenes]
MVCYPVSRYFDEYIDRPIGQSLYFQEYIDGSGKRPQLWLVRSVKKFENLSFVMFGLCQTLQA